MLFKWKRFWRWNLAGHDMRTTCRRHDKCKSLARVHGTTCVIPRSSYVVSGSSATALHTAYWLPWYILVSLPNKLNRTNFSSIQECITVGCVTSAAVAAGGGVYPSIHWAGGCNPACTGQGEGVSAWGGVPRGGVCHTHTLWTEW